MARGNYGQHIFKDDQDFKRFLSTLERSLPENRLARPCLRLMSNHYHLLIETPKPNLVAGMKWLQTQLVAPIAIPNIMKPSKGSAIERFIFHIPSLILADFPAHREHRCARLFSA